GRSCHGAPVRRIHNTPFNTIRRSLHGRPRPSARTRSRGKMPSTTRHCSSVKSPLGIAPSLWEAVYHNELAFMRWLLVQSTAKHATEMGYYSQTEQVRV